LNFGKLEDVFARFHGELDSWLQEENGKIQASNVRGQSQRETLRRCADRVAGFLLDYAPRDHADLGADLAGGGFTSRALPRFLEMLDEDRRALQDAMDIVTAFVERRFPENDELEKLKFKASPLPLLRAALDLLDTTPAPGRGAQNGAREKRGRRLAREPLKMAVAAAKEDGTESYSYSQSPGREAR
jgi:hypothetical protein